MPPRRVAICGMPGSGKTTAALTFPNPIVIDLDHKLKPGVPCIPFYSDEWIITNKLAVKPVPPKHLNRATLLLTWLQNELPKFAPEQTVILDSWTMANRYWDLQIEENPIFSNAGNRDGMKEFRAFHTWGQLVINALCAAKCTVVVTFHLNRDRDEKGNLNGKYRPVAAGQFGETILGNFTHALMALCRSKADGSTEYLWQIKGDNAFDSQGTYNESLLIDRRYVPAHYNSIAV